MPDIHIGYWWRRLLGIVRYLLRQTPHPVLLRYNPIRLDPEAIYRSAEAGEAFALPIRGRQVDVLVRPSTVQSPDARSFIDGETLDELPPLPTVTFVGSVVGAEDSDVRLTITPRTVTGFLRIGDEQNWIDPLRKFKRAADASQFIVYRPRDVVFRTRVANDVRMSGSEPPEGGGAHRVNPHVDLAVWSDVSFRDQAESSGLEWREAQLSVVNNLNGFYPSKVGIEFHILRHFLHTGTALGSDNPDTLLDQFGARVRLILGDIRQLSVRQNLGIELAHLMTGRNLDGDTIGIAFQPGVWGLSEIHYIGFWGPAPRNTLTIGHEIGHNFTGDHDLAEKICVSHFIWCWDYERTIMWPTIYSDNRKEFSKVNDERVTTNAQSGRAVNYTHT